MSTAELLERRQGSTRKIEIHRRAAVEVKSCDDQIAKLNAEIEALQARRQAAANDLLSQEEADLLVVGLTMIDEELANLGTRNDRAREVKRYHELTARRQGLEEKMADCKNRIELQGIYRSEAIEEADLPVEGLEITADGITFDGVPFAQKSSAARIRISMAVAMAANPKLRVIRVTNGSLISESNLKLIADIAAENDYQVWVELVDETGDVGIYIEDGEVKAVNP